MLRKTLAAAVVTGAALLTGFVAAGTASADPISVAGHVTGTT